VSKAIKGLGYFAGAAALGTAAFIDPALIATPLFSKAMGFLVMEGVSSEIGAVADALSSNRGTGITTRQSAAFRPIIYGERATGGSLVWQSTTSSSHRTYNLVVALAGHECDSILSCYLDGKRVFFDPSSTAGVATSPGGITFGGTADGSNHTGPDGLQYNLGGFSDGGRVFLSPHFGVDGDTTVDGNLTANDPNWSANAHGQPYLGGIAWTYLKLRYDPSNFPDRPEMRFVVRGYNKIYDPRDETYKYTNNLALCVLDVLLNPVWGLNCSLDDIDLDAAIAAANLADEDVDLAAGGTEKRYTCNYTCDTSTSPGDMIQAMLASGAGTCSNPNGKWVIQLGAYVAPTMNLNRSHITGPISLNPTQNFRDLANRVRGTYTAPFYPYSATDETGSNLYDTNGYWNGTTANTFNLAWQVTSYPFYAQDTSHGYESDQWLAEDDRIIYKDLNLAACISLATCQRLAKIELLRARLQQSSGTFQLALSAYGLRPGDTFQMTLPELGWTNKVLEVTAARLTPGYIDGNSGNVVPYVYEIDWKETNPLIYQWNEATEEQTIYAVPASGGGVPSIIDPPTGLTLTHQDFDFGGGGAFGDSASGSGILVSWTPSDDGYVTSTVIQYSRDGGSTWYSAGTVPQASFQTAIAPLASGTYQVQVAAMRPNGGMSSWTSASISF